MAESTRTTTRSGLGRFWGALSGTLDPNSLEMQQSAAEEGRQATEPPAGEIPETRDTDFDWKYYDKYDGVTGGWPELSDQQNYRHNRSIHRRFGTLQQRMIAYYETQIYLLECELDGLDKSDAISNPNILRGLPHQQNPPDEAALDRMTRREEIMEKLCDLFPKYAKLLLLEYKIRTDLPRISRREIRDFVQQLSQDNMLDESAIDMYLWADDCITTRTDREHAPFEWLVYGEDWLYEFLRRALLLKRYSDGKKYISKDRLRMISTSVIVLLTLGMLLSPMLILYLATLEKWHSALVVAIFCIISTTGMALQSEKPMRVFLAVSAYMAVLVTFLANLQGDQYQAL